QGKKLEAAKYYSYLIKQGVKDYRVFSNYGIFLNEIGKHKEAELEIKKAISLNPEYANAYYNLAVLYIGQGNFEKAELELKKTIKLKSDFAIAHYNLGFILKDQGKLKEAETHTQKALEVDDQFTDAYLSLSTMQTSNTSQKWHNQLFSESLLKNKNNRELVNIFFARSNIFHRKGKYEESAENLITANNIKLRIYKSEANLLIDKTKKLKISSENYERNNQEFKNYPMSIFIVGLPRCGSTLIESIISLNSKVRDLGEVNILEKSYREYKQSEKKINLSEIYWKKLEITDNKTTTTNKWLFNYQYAGIIAKAIPNAKIIHCYRNPLDNILSTYRAHFATGNNFSSSLVDSAEVYSDQDEIMQTYKKEFKNHIYSLNYDELVTHPSKEIKSLIRWLGWNWNDLYLSPHLNNRKVSTRSNVQVRSPINTKSLGGWKNYKEMLRPAMEIITKKNKYKDLKY
ncbi:sulfotransferase, partial [Prochlorococcus sp. AH-716-I19]|nr:sulfotransferase [Prochlorococcus sp. AH-716-I19]